MRRQTRTTLRVRGRGGICIWKPLTSGVNLMSWDTSSGDAGMRKAWDRLRLGSQEEEKRSLASGICVRNVAGTWLHAICYDHGGFRAPSTQQSKSANNRFRWSAVVDCHRGLSTR